LDNDSPEWGTEKELMIKLNSVRLLWNWERASTRQEYRVNWLGADAAMADTVVVSAG